LFAFLTFEIPQIKASVVPFMGNTGSLI